MPDITLDLVGLAAHTEALAREAEADAAACSRIVSVNSEEFAWVNGGPIAISEYLSDANQRRVRQLLLDHEKKVPVHTAGTLQAVADFVPVSDDPGFISAHARQVILWQSSVTLKGDRNRLITASASKCPFELGERYDIEGFVQGVLAGFADSEDKSRLLELFKKGVEVVDVATSRSDGVSQEMTVEKRTGLRDVVAFDNRFSLAPFRTFREIDQPLGVFVLRMHARESGVQAELVPIDDESWKLEAVASIKAFYEDAGVSVPVIG